MPTRIYSVRPRLPSRPSPFWHLLGRCLGTILACAALVAAIPAPASAQGVYDASYNYYSDPSTGDLTLSLSYEACGFSYCDSRSMGEFIIPGAVISAYTDCNCTAQGASVLNGYYASDSTYEYTTANLEVWEISWYFFSPTVYMSTCSSTPYGQEATISWNLYYEMWATVEVDLF
jgi:hypothetical protein